MNYKTPSISRSSEMKVPDWLYQESQEDDFLLGKVPQDIQYTWEDEE